MKGFLYADIGLLVHDAVEGWDDVRMKEARERFGEPSDSRSLTERLRLPGGLVLDGDPYIIVGEALGVFREAHRSCRVTKRGDWQRWGTRNYIGDTMTALLCWWRLYGRIDQCLHVGRFLVGDEAVDRWLNQNLAFTKEEIRRARAEERREERRKNK